MLTAKFFQNRRSQAIRLSKKYRFNDNEVLTHKIGNVVMIFSKSQENS